MALSRRYVAHVVRATRSAAQRARDERNRRYWQLMRSGMTNTEACRLLGMSRKTGGAIRRATGQQIPCLHPPHWSGRYLDARERVQIADLLRIGSSIRAIARVLGRAPSTIKRELDRHRDAAGRYLPAVAEHDAKAQRARPKVAKLVAQERLRGLVQRKLNRCWSPAQISGWLAKTYPGDPGMRVCPETIYRELLLREDSGLHRRYTGKLRTGRQIRKSRWLTTTGQGNHIKNPVMIDQRPPEVQARRQAGHWEGDLILGLGCASAMVTLRERVTHYGIIINLPLDHTAATVNAAVIEAFSHLPAHLKRTLTWDQGVEMSRHQELAAATGVRIYFAEKSSPWQRGANENFNGLVRQYFPKGTNLALHTPQRVAQVMAELNHRPRKSLGYDTPTRRFGRHLRGADSAADGTHGGASSASPSLSVEGFQVSPAGP